MSAPEEFVVGAFYESAMNYWQCLTTTKPSTFFRWGKTDGSTETTTSVVRGLTRISRPADWPLDQNNDAPKRTPQVGEFWEDTEGYVNHVYHAGAGSVATICRSGGLLFQMEFVNPDDDDDVQLERQVERPSDWPL